MARGARWRRRSRIRTARTSTWCAARGRAPARGAGSAGPVRGLADPQPVRPRRPRRPGPRESPRFPPAALVRGAGPQRRHPALRIREISELALQNLRAALAPDGPRRGGKLKATRSASAPPILVDARRSRGGSWTGEAAMMSTAISGGLGAAIERGLVRPASTLAAAGFDPAAARRFLQLLRAPEAGCTELRVLPPGSTDGARSAAPPTSACPRGGRPWPAGLTTPPG